jgi:hypothetical protein
MDLCRILGHPSHTEIENEYKSNFTDNYFEIMIGIKGVEFDEQKQVYNRTMFACI